MKTRFLLTLAAVIMAVNGFAAISLGEPVYDGNTISITGTNPTNNFMYKLILKDVSQSTPQVTLALTPFDPEQPAQVTAEDMIDQNFWEMVVRRYSMQLLGIRYNAQDCVTEIDVKNVALVKNLFYGYEKLKTLVIEADNGYGIPEGCFGEAYGLQYVKDMVSGTLTLGENSMPKGVAFEVETANAAIWQNLKEGDAEYYFGINAEGVTIRQAEITFNDGAVLKYGEEVPTLAERTLGEVHDLVITQNTLTVRLPQNQDPAAVSLFYKIYEAGKASTEQQAVVMGGYHYVDRGRCYTTTESSVVDLYGLEAGKDYVIEYYWVVAVDEETEYAFGKGNTRCRAYFTYEGNPPVITGATLYGISEEPIALAVSEFEPLYLAEPVEKLQMTAFDMYVSKVVNSAAMEYSIQDADIIVVDADKAEDGVWSAKGLNIDFAKDLEAGKQYKVTMAFRANNDYGTQWLDNDGQQYRIYFSTQAASGIADIKADNTDGKWYTLDGRVVDGNSARPGIYIVNGKKVIK